MLRGILGWMGPAIVVGLSFRVFRGDPLAPLAVVLAALVPLVALVRVRDTRPATAAHLTLALPGLAVLLAAHAAAVADVVQLDGVPRWVAALLVLLCGAVPLLVRQASTWVTAGVLGCITIVAALVAIALVTWTPPWSAWTHVATRGALVFGERSRWVTDGRAMSPGATLAFDEPHRVTAVSAAQWHVTETDGVRSITRERRVVVGDSLVLRPGDRLAVDAGAQVKFERGKRVPGTVVTGVEWGDARERRTVESVSRSVGTTVTFAGAALALVPPAAAVTLGGAAGAVAVAVVLALGAATWGVYAMYAAPELALGATIATPLAELPGSVFGVAAGGAAVAVVGVAMLALYAAAVAATTTRVETVAAAVSERARAGAVAACGGFVVIAAAATLWRLEPERLLALGLGLLATTWAAPALAPGAPRPVLTGALVGAGLFAILALAADRIGAGLLAEHPAALAAPAAWATTMALARSRARDDGP